MFEPPDGVVLYLGWDAMPEIPPVLVVRLRVLKEVGSLP